MTDWIKHDGGPMPVDGDTSVEVKYRDGETEVLRCAKDAAGGKGNSDWWDHEGDSEFDEEDNCWITDHGCDIIAYRLIDQNQD